MDTGVEIAVLNALVVQQLLVLDLVNVQKDQRELENVTVKVESQEVLVTFVQPIILVHIVNKVVLLKVQVLFVPGTEHVMQEHQCRQEIALVLKVGMEIIGKFVSCCWCFFFFVCFNTDSLEYHNIFF